MTDDRKLLEQYTIGHSESAFGELVKRHIDLVYAAALRLTGGDRHLAEDAAQTVFIDLARKGRLTASLEALNRKGDLEKILAILDELDQSIDPTGCVFGFFCATMGGLANYMIAQLDDIDPVDAFRKARRDSTGVPPHRSAWKGNVAALAFATGLAASAAAADLSAPVHKVDGSFVREWLVLGPFPSPEMGTDFLAGVGGEANVRPREGDTVKRKDGTILRWTRFRSERDWVDLEKVFGVQPWSVAYVYCELSADQAGESDVRGDCGYGGSALWLNGKKVGPVPESPLAHRPYDPRPSLPISLNAGRNPCLLKMKREHGVEDWTFNFQPLPPARAHLEVKVTDAAGKNVAGAVVYFYHDRKPVERATTDALGNASACIFPTAGLYNLHVTAPGMEAWASDVALPPGERRSLAVALKNDTVSISGRVLAKDESPQSAIVVQAVRIGDLPETLRPPTSGHGIGRDRLGKSGPLDRAAPPNQGRADLPALPKLGEGRPVPPKSDEGGPVRPDVALENRLGFSGGGSINSLLPAPPFSATTFTDTNGVFRFVNLQPGKYRLRCQGRYGYFYTDGGEDSHTVDPIEVEPGRTRTGIDFVLPEIKKGVATILPFATSAPLRHRCIYRTQDGLLWIGTLDYTLQAFDGREYKTFALTDKPNEVVEAMEQSADGTLWIGSAAGISKVVDGRRKSVPFDDSLPRKRVHDILAEPDGTVWFATDSGLCKYDGRKLVTFSVKDGLPSNEVLSLMRSRDGTLWVGASLGLVVYDGVRFQKPKSFPYEGRVQSLLEARNGAIWFAGTVGEGAYC